MGMNECELLQRFGNNLRELLNEAWMSQRDLSEMTGISESTISYYAKGERAPSLKNIMRICYAMDCTYEELIGRPVYTN